MASQPWTPPFKRMTLHPMDESRVQALLDQFDEANNSDNSVVIDFDCEFHYMTHDDFNAFADHIKEGYVALLDEVNEYLIVFRIGNRVIAINLVNGIVQWLPPKIDYSANFTHNLVSPANKPLPESPPNKMPDEKNDKKEGATSLKDDSSDGSSTVLPDEEQQHSEEVNLSGCSDASSFEMHNDIGLTQETSMADIEKMLAEHGFSP